MCLRVHMQLCVCLCDFKTRRWKGVVITGKRICRVQKYPRTGTNWAKSLRSLDLLRVYVYALKCLWELVFVCVWVKVTRKRERARERLIIQFWSVNLWTLLLVIGSASLAGQQKLVVVWPCKGWFLKMHAASLPERTPRISCSPKYTCVNIPKYQMIGISLCAAGMVNPMQWLRLSYCPAVSCMPSSFPYLLFLVLSEGLLFLFAVSSISPCNSVLTSPSLFLSSQLTMTSLVSASCRKHFLQTPRSPCPFFWWNQKRPTSSRTSQWTSTARPRQLPRSTSSATASGCIKRSIRWKKG